MGEEPHLKTLSDWKNFGNKQFVLKNYHEALKAYTIGLALCSNEDPDLLSNRAATYLNLEHYCKALEDAETVLKAHPNHAKAIYRKAKALLGLSKCEDAIIFLKSELEKYKKPNKDVQELLQKAELMRDQQITKEYDVPEHFYRYFCKIENWAEYYGPAEVRSIQGKGRGLIATSDIEEGDLIFCARAFAIEFHDPNKQVLDLYDPQDSILNHPAVVETHDKDGCLLIQRIYERIIQDPELGKAVYQLFAGMFRNS